VATVPEARNRPLVVVHADDLGLSPAASRGILRAHHEGVVTSTSLLANLPGAEEGATLARQAPALEVGLHLNLTEGRPLTDARSLTSPDGAFRPLRAQLLALLFSRTDADEVAREVEAQLARARALGLSITHLDGHQHVHVFGDARAAAFALARREGLTIRRPRERGLLRDLGRHLSLLARRMLLFSACGGPEWREVPHADAMLDLTGPAHGRSAPWLIERLGGMRGVVEVLCHPGEADGPDDDPLRDRRPEELALLTAPGLAARFVEAGLQLTTFRDAFARSAP
jgi:predicted glycoside hydrolase/deacetylase ChbG (UPF0249 family)